MTLCQPHSYWPDGRDDLAGGARSADDADRPLREAQARNSKAACIVQAMQLHQARTPLAPVALPDLVPTRHEVRVRVAACGVCRTDLHVVDGELPHPKLPLIPGHEIVGRIDAIGDAVTDDLRIGQRVGIPWLGNTCG